MSREEAFDAIRRHLSEELGIDSAIIEAPSRFKEDLGADSLDLVELQMELEDTYGVKMSDEQAAKILTVGQAVDFVVANASDREPRP
jgi:acyl carrier protein